MHQTPNRVLRLSTAEAAHDEGSVHPSRARRLYLTENGRVQRSGFEKPGPRMRGSEPVYRGLNDQNRVSEPIILYS